MRTLYLLEGGASRSSFHLSTCGTSLQFYSRWKCCSGKVSARLPSMRAPTLLMPARGTHSGAHTHTAAQGGTVQEGKLRSGGISKSPKATLLERGRVRLSLQPSQAQAGSRGQSLEVELASFPSGCPDQFCSLGSANEGRSLSPPTPHLPWEQRMDLLGPYRPEALHPGLLLMPCEGQDRQAPG